MRLIAFFILVFSMSACGGGFDIYSPNNIYRTIQPHPNREGLYLVHYRYKEMIEVYGPGWEKTLAAVRQAKNNKEIYNIWNQTLTLAVPKYLEEKKLIPDECIHGIVAISSNMNESGGGTTVLRCY